jgi:hypothetical protein
VRASEVRRPLRGLFDASRLRRTLFDASRLRRSLFDVGAAPLLFDGAEISWPHLEKRA